MIFENILNQLFEILISLGQTACLSMPCINGECVSTGPEQFTCMCPSQWRGNTCNIDVDECNNSPCQNGGSCDNSAGGYTCRCIMGFAGNNCELGRPSINDIVCLFLRFVYLKKITINGIKGKVQHWEGTTASKAMPTLVESRYYVVLFMKKYRKCIQIVNFVISNIKIWPFLLFLYSQSL